MGASLFSKVFSITITSQPKTPTLVDLDETHLFVIADCKAFLREKVAELMNDNSFPIGLDTV